MTRENVSNFGIQRGGNSDFFLIGGLGVPLLDTPKAITTHPYLPGQVLESDVTPRAPDSQFVLLHDDGILRWHIPSCQQNSEDAATLVDVARHIGRLALNIRKFRRKMGLNQTALAERVGTGQTHISKWECGRQRVELKNRALLAKALSVTEGVLDPDDEAYDPEASRITEQLGENLAKAPDALKEAFGLMTPEEIALVANYRKMAGKHQDWLRDAAHQMAMGREPNTEGISLAPRRRIKR